MQKITKKSNVRCPNIKCSLHNKKGLKNIVRNGHKQNGIQNLKCKKCGTQFTITKGTILYHKKLKIKNIANIIKSIVKTGSLRGAARETKFSMTTICNYYEQIIQNPKQYTKLMVD